MTKLLSLSSRSEATSAAGPGPLLVPADAAVDNPLTMPADRRILILVLVPIAGALWWLLQASPEERVRAAHQELAARISKTEDDSQTPTVRDVFAYQALFAGQVTLVGDAGDLGGSYTPEDIAGLIVRVRAIFERIELGFTDPVIEFPSEDTAVARFTAEALVSPAPPEITDGSETRAVTSRMQLVDGDWLFTHFEMQTAGAD